MLRFWSSMVLLLFCLQRVCASGSSRCETPEGKCDFVCDCSDCSDEQNCGYSGKSFECDFEDEGVCGWKIESVGEEYKWQRVQSGGELPESGPTSDYTTGTATGWFMSVSAVGAESLQSSVLISPEIKGSSPTCRLRLRYFLWDSGLTGLGPTPLWASILHRDSQEAVVWRPETSSARSWREATVFLGRISSPFRIHLHSARSAGQNGDVAIDQLEFLDCALPSLPAGTSCPEGMVPCGGEGCVEQRQVCDGTDDCGDGSDEAPCGDYYHCDFEEDMCDWDLRSFSKLKWIRTNQEDISRTDPWKGPGRDHSNNTASGYFLYVTVPDGGLTMDWAAFQSPRLQPTNSSHPCKMVMYTHQFGPRSGGLTVLVADQLIYPVWERGGALGDLWVKAEVEIVSNYTFQILIMAAIRDLDYGGIAVDSIVLSPECRWSSDNTTLEKFPKPPKNPCIDDPEKMCDFQADCDAAEDEAKCGDFSYPEGSSGWTDTSIGSQGWLLDKSSTTGEFLYVAEAAGQQLTEAQIRTPLLGPTGPVCNLSFDFALTGSLDHIGELSVRVIDSLLGVRPKLWEFSGKTGAGDEEETWQHVDVPIGVRKHRFQLAFEARAVEPFAWIKVRNVQFISCHADYIPSSPTGASCIFEDGLCAWYQDNSDNFDWSVVTGMDHSIGVGTSLVVDMWSPSLRGAFGRLLSFPQQPTATESCLTFYYKLYGPNAGALNVKLTDSLGYEILLWTRSGAHGNEWHEAHCPVPQQNTNFQLMFEAVRSGFDGQVAIDDVAFLVGPCTIPRKCSFEGQKCGYSSYGAINWLHRNGHTTTANGPKTDHTLGTELGYYMMVNTDADVLPPGSAAVLISPVQQGTTKPECVSFWYHMTEGNPAFFTVYVKPQKGERVPIFSENLNEGDDWRRVNGNVSVGLVSWQLEFEVVGSGSRGSHVAVDDITVSAHPCEDQGSKCSLENGMCSWINIQDREREKLDWELTSTEKEKHYPVPPLDHTLGTEKGHFLFFPSSNRTAANEKAWLVSPQLPPIKPNCLRFWAYKPQSSDCQLRIWSLSGGIIYQQLIVNELSGPWRHFELNITSREGYQIVFEGIKGTSGFVALDDIEYTVGFDCATRDTKPTSKPDNAGGIAASVIVVVLLIGTLVALLVFYLRTKPDANSPSLAIGISNEGYVPEDPVTVPPRQNHPMAAGFNNVSISAEVKKREEEE